MRALRVDDLGDDARLVTMAEPDRGEVGAGESIVQVRAAVVGHLDLQIIRGEVSLRPVLPLVPGSEGAGVVVASGSLAPGTPVRVRGGGVGVKRSGTWCELVTAPDSALTVLSAPSDEIDWAMAAAFFSPVATAWAAVHDVARLHPGERVLVTGAAGAVGSMAVQIAARHGCVVVGLVGSAAKVNAVPSVAELVVVFDGNLDLRRVGELDGVIDTVGGAPLAAVSRGVRPRGRIALVGYTAGDRIDVPISDLLLGDLTLLPTNLLRRAPGLAARTDGWLSELATGALTLDVHAFDLGDLEGAVAALADRDVNGRVVLVP